MQEKIKNLLSNPRFVDQIKKALGEPLFSKIGEDGKRNLRALLSKLFQINSELVGVFDGEDALTIEIGTQIFSFAKQTTINFDQPIMNEERQCVGCGSDFVTSIENANVFCIKCLDKGKT